MARFDGFQSILCYWEYERAKEKEVSDASVPKKREIGSKTYIFQRHDLSCEYESLCCHHNTTVSVTECMYEGTEKLLLKVVQTVTMGC